MTSRIYLKDLEDVGRLLPSKVTVSIVGFGYIGTCIGALLAARGARVVGIDNDEKRVEEINDGTTSIPEP